MRHASFPATPCEIERLLHHLQTIHQRPQSEFAESFAGSILKQSRRRNWSPSEKQLGVMRKLVSELFSHPIGQGEEDDIQVIE